MKQTHEIEPPTDRDQPSETDPPDGSDDHDGAGHLPGRLVLVATPIGNLGDITRRAVEVLGSADLVACEDTRHTRKLLSHLQIPAGSRLVALHAHNESASVDRIIGSLHRGRNVALVTDAGMPGISDPGSLLVRAAAEAGVEVTVVPGPSAVLCALVISGMDTSRFCFEGFLPRRGRERERALDVLSHEMRTAVIFEAPSRVATTIADLADRLGGFRRVAVIRELTKRFESVWRGDLAGAVRHVAGSEPRGEYVLVLAGAPEPDPPGDAEIQAALDQARGEGISRREAVAWVASILGVGRNRVYRLATAMDPAESQ
ncbi:MAG: 16S rRNA (cytidine(1402)-2'-O)-methyltransferase [Acidimicrobiales bacterium]